MVLGCRDFDIAPTYFENQSHGNIPRLVQSLTVLGENVPKVGPIEAGALYIQDFHFNLRVHISKFLE